MVESYILTQALMQTALKNPKIVVDFTPFAVLNRTLSLLGKSKCNCGSANAHNAKKVQDAYNQCKMGVTRMSSDKIEELKSILGVNSIDVTYQDQRGVTHNVKI